MNAVIKAADFANYLHEQGLIIVSKVELERMAKIEVNQKRKDLLSRTHLKLAEILKLELLQVKSKRSLERWIENGTFLPSEVSKNRLGQTIILTSSLYRLGYVQK